jgi:hypothetical protein
MFELAAGAGNGAEIDSVTALIKAAAEIAIVASHIKLRFSSLIFLRLLLNAEFQSRNPKLTLKSS